MPALREILVLHHSHLDVGYTHSQPVAWELHREYIDQALDLLDATAGWPDDGSRPKWTCEVTAPVLKWLETVSGADVERFRAHVRAGRLSVGAMRFNITPLMDAGQLRRQLEPVAGLRAKLGAPIRAAHQHDINGVPWPLADVLLDHGVDLLTMAVNRHLGNHVRPRPGVFRWRAPSGRELRVLNGNHYTMFDQILLTWERSLDAMRKGLDDYTRHLDGIGYPHDFLYLTTTAAPEMWDNSPPNLPVAKLIREWNARALMPRIRYVTSEDLVARVGALPADRLPLQSGDWTDYWNFGCASTADAVARSRAAKRAIAAAERLDPQPSTPVCRVAARARGLLDLFDEHTWSYWDTATGTDPARVQDQLKAAPVFEARELAAYLLAHQLEALAGNPAQSEGPPDHVLLVNASPLPRAEYVDIPVAWRKPGPRLRCERFKPDGPGDADTCGPVEVPAYGWKRVPLASLTTAADDKRVWHQDRRTPSEFRAFNNVRIEIARQGDAIIESPFHRLAYDPATGRVLGLLDKKLNWEVLPVGVLAFAGLTMPPKGGTPTPAEVSFFDFVRERPDALVDGRREAYYERDLDKEKIDQSCWKNWRAIREKAVRGTRVEARRGAGSVSLERDFEAPGTNFVRQRITLRADSPTMEIAIEIDKLACADPEGVYFTIPLNLGAGWRCHFDTAGQPVELDAEQLPGACRNWFTVGSYASMHAGDRGATLFCPDAPMAMAGGFHFGPPLESVPRDANPLLLAWPLNNYWNTNFPLVQPGRIRLRYGLMTHGAFDAAEAARHATAFAQPILAHPAFGGTEGSGNFP
jgi:alpha-mannosidase